MDMPGLHKALPTRERILSLFDFDEASGSLTWKSNEEAFLGPSRCRFSGRVAGHISGGRRVVGIDGKQYLAHRIIYFLSKGVDPGKDEVDHKDMQCMNNDPTNLRAASHAKNNQNKGASKRNRFGLKGVFPNRKRFSAQIVVDQRKIHLGTFDTPELAHAAYCEAANSLHGEFARSEKVT